MPIRLFLTLVILVVSPAIHTGAESSAPGTAMTRNPALESICRTIISLADDNGIDLSAYANVDGTALSIVAVMTDEDESIDYIAGYLSRENALAMLAPHLASFLMANPEITAINGSITDQAGQSIKLNYTSKEVLESLSIY